MHTTNYSNVFIEIAEDCPVTAAEIPPQKEDAKTIARLQYEMIISNPYQYTSDDVIFNTYAIKNGIAEDEYKAKKIEFFSKGQPCMRSSPLTKRYGWGVHSDKDGKIAIFAMESKEYKDFLENAEVVRKKAMRSKRV